MTGCFPMSEAVSGVVFPGHRYLRHILLLLVHLQTLPPPSRSFIFPTRPGLRPFPGSPVAGLGRQDRSLLQHRSLLRSLLKAAPVQDRSPGLPPPPTLSWWAPTGVGPLPRVRGVAAIVTTFSNMAAPASSGGGRAMLLLSRCADARESVTGEQGWAPVPGRRPASLRPLDRGLARA